MNWLKELAPLLGTALAGPLGGAAASFIASKLGIADETVEAVTDVLNSTKLSAEQLSAIKAAELEFKKFLADAKIREESVYALDRDSARKMQIETKSVIPGALATLVTAGFFGILIFMLGNEVKPSDVLLVLLGALAASWQSIVNFYFGSSKGSEDKNALLHKITKE